MNIYFYFELKKRIFARRMKDYGINPWLGVLILIIVFLLFSFLLFQNTKINAAYIYTIIPFVFLLKTNNENETAFFKSIYSKKEFLAIKILQNIIIVFPFVFFLFFKNFIFVGGLLLLGSVFLSFFNFRIKKSQKLKIPFLRNSFEFIVGFRNSFYWIPLLLVFLVIGQVLDNDNFLFLLIGFLFLIFSSYYLNPEPPFYVWVYALTPIEFLFLKFSHAIGNATLIIVPFVLIEVLFFDFSLQSLFILLGIGMFFLFIIILLKYSTYPNENHILEGVILVMCIFFPPILIVFLPYLFIKSKQKLKNYL